MPQKNMATEVYEDTQEWAVQTVETLPFDPAQTDSLRSYPLPQLRLTGRTAQLSFRVVILENDFTQVVICPDLGGRIVEWLDKRTSTKVITLPPVLPLEARGPRGVELLHGIRWSIGSPHHVTGMGPIEVQAHENGWLVLHELAAGSPLSWHATIELADDRAELEISIRLLNRGLVRSRYGAGVTLPGPVVNLGPSSYAWGTGSGGVAVHADAGMFEGCSEHTVWRGHPESGGLAGRQTDTFSFVLQPISGLDGLSAATRAGALFVSAGKVQVLAARHEPESKLHLRTQDGQTLEASAELNPARPLEIALAGLQAEPSALAWLNARGEVLAEWHSGGDHVAEPPKPVRLAEPSWVERELAQALQDGIPTADATATFARAARDPMCKAGALIASAMAAAGQRDFGRAASMLEEALLVAGDDHLAWWLKAACHRLGGEGERDNQPELPNAHYLAPLEPILRVEGFLSQPMAMGKEPSPLIAPIAQHPDAMVEAACLLLEAGLTDQASRWIDEAFRHQDLPMLRYLMAWALLKGSRMTVEAADHVSAAERLPDQPPYPWRPIERAAIRDLSTRFPKAARLSDWSSWLASSFRA